MADGTWWQRGVVYQVYPRSFQDTNGDGVGDLEGVRRRLPYLRDLGVDALWLSPFYPSPGADFGYDISDHCGVDPLFGTLDDIDRLIAEAHALGLKVVLDLVPNHTAADHPWFRESRSSRAAPKRDWYIWRDPGPDGAPPNNWLSHFGGPAWTLDPATGQFYYHAYLSAQPDLNWRNPAVREAMHAVMRFWLQRGVDGFRVDVMWHLVKDAAFRDDPVNPDWTPGRPQIERLRAEHSADQPEVHEIVAQMRRTLEAFGDTVLIGEIYLPLDRLVAYYGPDGRGAHLPFNFHLIETPWTAAALGRLVADYEAALPQGAWPNWVLGNHDRPRIASRVGPAQARIAAMLLLTLRGTPTLYYGDEIGLPDGTIPADAVRDPWAAAEPERGRDPVRTPMPWDGTPGAGFTTGRPWLPLDPDWPARNVAAQARDPRSMLTLHRRLLALRRAHRALALGSWRLVGAAEPVLAYERTDGAERFVVALNLGSAPARAALPGGASWRVALSTALDREGEGARGAVDLRPDEGLVLQGVG